MLVLGRHQLNTHHSVAIYFTTVVVPFRMYKWNTPFSFPPPHQIPNPISSKPLKEETNAANSLISCTLFNPNAYLYLTSNSCLFLSPQVIKLKEKHYWPLGQINLNSNPGLITLRKSLKSQSYSFFIHRMRKILLYCCTDVKHLPQCLEHNRLSVNSSYYHSYHQLIWIVLITYLSL